MICTHKSHSYHLSLSFNFEKKWTAMDEHLVSQFSLCVSVVNHELDDDDDAVLTSKSWHINKYNEVLGFYYNRFIFCNNHM